MRFFNKSRIASIILVLSLFAAGCRSQNDESLLAPKEFQQAIATTKGTAIILDVRTPDEFVKGHLDNAINIDWNAGEEAFANQLQHVPKDKPLFVYCQGGGRSAGAVIKLQNMGFTNVRELKGGWVAWNSEFGNSAPAKNWTGMTMEDFQEKLKTDKVVLVDFNAQWCAPCQKMKPFLHEMQKEMGDKLEVIFIDTDQNPDIATLFKIEALPTLMIYKGGVKEWHHLGYMSKDDLIKQVKTHY